MRMESILLLLAVMLAGCATGLPPKGERAPLLRSGGTPTATMQRALYDRDADTCSPGASQLLPQAEFQSLLDGWKEVQDDAACTGATFAGTPAVARYPEVFRGRNVSGAAHVLVLLERDGSVASAHAVCATGDAFAAAAEETARRIAYTPLDCDGSRKRSAVMVPFGYEI